MTAELQYNHAKVKLSGRTTSNAARKTSCPRDRSSAGTARKSIGAYTGLSEQKVVAAGQATAARFRCSAPSFIRRRTSAVNRKAVAITSASGETEPYSKRAIGSSAATTAPSTPRGL